MLGIVVALLAERRTYLAVDVGALALVLVLPITIHALLTFSPSSPEQLAEAQRILVHVRIPHHARTDLWLDWVGALQIAWMVLGSGRAWGTRLFAPLTVSLIGAALLTGAQTLTESDGLALLFPWRVSSVLLPVATTVVLSRLLALRGLPLD